MISDADIISANTVLGTRASALFNEMVRAYPVITQNPALELDVDQAIDHCIRNFNPTRGDLQTYVASTVMTLVRHHRGHSKSLQLDDIALAGLEDGTVALSTVIAQPSELHRAEMVIDQLKEPDRIKLRVMLHVKNPEDRELIFGVQAIERAKLEGALVAKVRQLAMAA